MSRKKTILVAVLSALALSACGTPQTKAKFPEAPELLMREPADLGKQKLKDDPLLSDVETQHIRETNLFREVREQLLGLQNWVRKQKDAAEK
jgi:uncharacterized protein YcfL